MRIDVSSVTSHFPNPQDGFTTTTSGSVSSGASTVGLNSTGDYSNGDIVVLIIDPADSDKKQVFVGTIDTAGVQVTGVMWVGGTNQSHSTGATVVDYYDAAHVRMTTKGLLVSHNQDGTIKNGAVSSAAMLGNNVVTEAKVADDAITPSKWTNPYSFRAYQSSNQSVPAATQTKIQFQSESYDLGSNFDNATNYRFTAPITGIYHFDARTQSSNGSQSQILITLYKNGAEHSRGYQVTGLNGFYGANVGDDIQLTASDYVEVYAFINGNTANLSTGSNETYFSGHLVSPT